jgi:5'-3' exonuclease
MVDKDLFKNLLNNLKESKEEPIDKNSRVLLIDSMNTFIRSFSAVNYLNTDGHHIGGLTGTLVSAGYAIKNINPTRVIFVFDGKGSTDNKKNLYPEYKGNRNTGRITNWDIFEDKEEEVEAMENQMERLIQYLQQLPVSLITIDKMEADDIIAYIAKNIENKGGEAFIMSADKDFLQLVSNKITVYSPTKKKFYTPNDVKEEYGLLPDNYIHYKALLGDSSDNIPGVSGLGPKKLFKLFPNLSLKTLTYEDITNTAKEKISEHKLYGDIIERNKQLSINYTLMDLKNLNIHEDDIQTIDNIINSSPFKYNRNNFIIMYKNDLLGNSIRNVEMWVDDVFRYLTTFK